MEFTLTPMQVAVKVLDRILTNPESHDQTVWSNILKVFSESRVTIDRVRNTCGTRACVAGWAVIFVLPDDCYLSTYSAYQKTDQPAFNRRLGDISDIAQEALGLSVDQANWLFKSSRSYDEIVYHLRKFIGKGNWNKIPLDSDTEDL